jgi:hypothetical protein
MKNHGLEGVSNSITSAPVISGVTGDFATSVTSASGTFSTSLTVSGIPVSLGGAGIQNPLTADINPAGYGIKSTATGQIVFVTSSGLQGRAVLSAPGGGGIAVVSGSSVHLVSSPGAGIVQIRAPGVLQAVTITGGLMIALNSVTVTGSNYYTGGTVWAQDVNAAVQISGTTITGTTGQYAGTVSAQRGEFSQGLTVSGIPVNLTGGAEGIQNPLTSNLVSGGYDFITTASQQNITVVASGFLGRAHLYALGGGGRAIVSGTRSVLVGGGASGIAEVSANGALGSVQINATGSLGSILLNGTTVTGTNYLTGGTISGHSGSFSTGLTISGIPVALGNQHTSFINVRDYGALGNGSTDDTTAINNAITAASIGPRVVYFPAGNYVHSGLTITTSGLRVDLSNEATLFLAAGSNSNSIQITTSDVTIAGGGTIDGNRDGQADP